ncbi:MAG: hypothetical protein F4066_11075 [Chloroflexi bacterium]|nr:hypothetical protein [Chloroflexota bacterium]MYF80823.1 hypothetical protein [Chloroflexota bacterium]MYI05383.1 hypothetical protein [Chloroflexota bacterium]
MLRESSKRNGSLDSLNLQGAVGPEADSGVPHGDLLTAFAEAAVRRTDALPGLRERIAAELGVQELVDAAGVVANFQRMVRIADGCGIPLDELTRDATDDVRDELGLHEYASAANTA